MATLMGKPAAILLAAGSSTRFGGEKLLYPVGGKPLFQHTFDTVRQSGFGQVVVVTNQHKVEQAALVYGFTTVPNPNAAHGISTSIACGIAACPTAPAWAFFVCDQPLLTPASVKHILKAFEGSGKATIPRFGGTPGSPCIFPAQYKESLLALTGDTGGKAILNSLPPEAITYTDLPFSAEGKDLDTKADLAETTY